MATFDFTGTLPQFKALIASAQLRNRYNDLKTHLNTFNPAGLTLPAADGTANQALVTDGDLTSSWSNVIRSNVDLAHSGGNGTSGQVLQSDGDGTTSWLTFTGLSDGNKGDITVSGSGSVFTVDNDAVTTVKILDANVTAGKLASGAVTTAKILDDAVDADKINTITYALSASTSAINAQTGTAYTALATDNGRIVTLTNASAITVTVPDSMPANFTCTYIQSGAGQVTIAVSGTLVLRNSQSNTDLLGQWAVASVTRISDTNDLVLTGDLTP